jgi:hypothetical protein
MFIHRKSVANKSNKQQRYSKNMEFPFVFGSDMHHTEKLIH